ncbi:translocation protein Sec62-domain-containing protein [Lineolata rhizophorae]|uniref:Translocation protein SEC62 n=1 Tax=Lineolata rhizophorae TaxID=578093 RepID=A0A6A6NY51_9PEZI|nr:translocation protein Sec62-domain-containing protein [Lineolata rhizophorae]
MANAMPSGGPMPMPQPGAPGQQQQPTPQQIQAMQQQLAAAAAREGVSVQEYVQKLRQQALAQRAAFQQQQQRGGSQGQGGAGGGGGPGGPPPQQMMMPQGQPGQQQGGRPGMPPPGARPVQPGPPKPEALAVANFLKGQDLKPRTCIFQEKRKDMFKVKRAIRALQSPAYEKARTKNPLLPEVKDRPTAENAFKLLPLSLLALRVSKIDPHAGHAHGPSKQKRVKGLWTVKIEQQQETKDGDHYIWLYEGSQWRTKAYAALALALVFAVVLFPLWPLKMRQGVWYLSVGVLGLIGCFFAMALVRLLLFVVTFFVVPPGLWLYPNLFEDVGFFDSFKPLWGWHGQDFNPQKAKKKSKKAKKAEAVATAGSSASTNGKAADSASPAPAAAAAANSDAAKATSAAAAPSPGGATQRKLHASVEEVEEE